jgi:hypothetical protein
VGVEVATPPPPPTTTHHRSHVRFRVCVPLPHAVRVNTRKLFHSGGCPTVRVSFAENGIHCASHGRAVTPLGIGRLWSCGSVGGVVWKRVSMRLYAGNRSDVE